MAQATITSKGQITIPAEVRRQLNLSAGDKVLFITGDTGEVIMAPATRNVKSLKGMIEKPTRAVTLEEMKKAISERFEQ